MHELGLVAGVLDCVDTAAKDAHATRVLGVSLKIGVMTEAVEEALRFAFEVLTEGTISEGAQLEIEMVEPRSRCLECGCEFDHDRFHRECPACGSLVTELIAGRELMISSIEVDIPDGEDQADQHETRGEADRTVPQ